jgi:hypothetical protein
MFCVWNWLVQQKVLSDRGVYITVRNVCRIIRYSSIGTSFPCEIFATDDSSCESLRCGSAPTSSLPDVIVLRLLEDLTPSLM